MGYKQKTDVPTMERELNYLLYDLCVIWGFCIPPPDGLRISKTKHFEAVKFAEEIVIAEGMDVEYDYKWVNRIADKFKERFGQEEINEATFVDRIRGLNEKW